MPTGVSRSAVTTSSAESDSAPSGPVAGYPPGASPRSAWDHAGRSGRGVRRPSSNTISIKSIGRGRVTAATHRHATCRRRPGAGTQALLRTPALPRPPQEDVGPRADDTRRHRPDLGDQDRGRSSISGRSEVIRQARCGHRFVHGCGWCSNISEFRQESPNDSQASGV